MDFGAYVLSTVNGFKSKPFGVRAVWQILAGEESQLDLNSAFGLKAGDSIMRYQRIPISGRNIHAYSIYQGAMEPNAGRNGTFIGLSLIFEEKIDAQEIALGQRLRDLLDGLSKKFIKEKRFIKNVDSKAIEEFCNDDDYHEIMTDILDKGEILSNVAPVPQKKKSAFYCAKQDIYDSFNEICNSEAADDQIYLISNTTGNYRAIARNLAIHVSDWPIPSPPVLIKKIPEGKKFTYPPTKTIKSSDVSVKTPQKNEDNNKNEEDRSFLKFYNLSSVLKTAGVVFVSVLTGCLLMFFFDTRKKVQQQVAPAAPSGTSYKSEDTVSKVEFNYIKNKVVDLSSQLVEIKKQLVEIKKQIADARKNPSILPIPGEEVQQTPLVAPTGTPEDNTISQAVEKAENIADKLIGIYQKSTSKKIGKQTRVERTNILENSKKTLRRILDEKDGDKYKTLHSEIKIYTSIINKLINIHDKTIEEVTRGLESDIKDIEQLLSR